VLGFNPDLNDYPFDLQRAKQLVREAGAQGTELTMVVPSGRYPNDREVGAALSDMLTAAGFKMKTSFTDTEKWLDALFAASTAPAKSPDLMFVGYSNDLLDSFFTLNQILACGGAAAAFCDKDITAAIKAGNVAKTLDGRAADYQRAWKLDHERMYFATFAVVYQQHGIAKNVDWTPRPQIFVFFDEIHKA
jgi:peptide/nickel transport system substrate-binding protein